MKNKDLEKIKLPKDVEVILNDTSIPEETRETIKKVITSIVIHETFSGPIPPPRILGEYNDVVENGAERILQMAEKQSKHRISLEEFVVKEELNQSRKGQFFGFILGISGMAIAAWLAFEGHDTVAGIFATTTILGLVTVFVIGKSKNSEK